MSDLYLINIENGITSKILSLDLKIFQLFVRNLKKQIILFNENQVLFLYLSEEGKTI